jgi:hypothetical protein
MKNLEPNNHRISNSLFESIKNVMAGKTEQVAENAGAAVDKAHFCATHVEHALLGQGVCVSEQHAEPDQNGDIAWYSVEFTSGIQRVNTSNLKITEGKSHTHGKKMSEEEEVAEEETIEEGMMTPAEHEAALKAHNEKASDAGHAHDNVGLKKHTDMAAKHADALGKKYTKTGYGIKMEGNDGNLANNAKPYDKVTRGDVIAGRLGKDEMGGKKKKVAESSPIKQDKIDFNNAPAPVSKSTEDKEKKGAMSKAVSAHNTGKGGTDAPKASNPKAMGEARSTGTVFDKPKDSPLTKDIKSAFNKKQISTGTVYTRKPQKDMDDKGKKIKESITQTVINYNDFVLEITDNPTYGDYLKALQTMVESRDESIQHEVVALATEAFNEKIDSIIVEAKARITFEPRLQALRESGVQISDENYVVENNEPYVEYTVEKDGKSIQYVHMGKVQKV